MVYIILAARPEDKANGHYLSRNGWISAADSSFFVSVLIWPIIQQIECMWQPYNDNKLVANDEQSNKTNPLFLPWPWLLSPVSVLISRPNSRHRAAFLNQPTIRKIDKPTNKRNNQSTDWTNQPTNLPTKLITNQPIEPNQSDSPTNQTVITSASLLQMFTFISLVRLCISVHWSKNWQKQSLVKIKLSFFSR